MEQQNNKGLRDDLIFITNGEFIWFAGSDKEERTFNMESLINFIESYSKKRALEAIKKEHQRIFYEMKLADDEFSIARYIENRNEELLKQLKELS